LEGPTTLLPRATARLLLSSLSLMLLASCFVFLTAHTLCAQTPVFDATHLSVPRDLNEGWLIHAGDEPSFAQPEFDDSNWTAIDPRTPLQTVFHGAHPQVVWYRLHIRIDSAQTGIALREESLARAFEIYVNGERIVTSGGFAPLRQYTYASQILTRIPDRMAAAGHLTVALRIGISGLEWSNGLPGLSPGNLTLGPQGALADKDWLKVIGENFVSLLDKVLTVGLGVVALPLFLSQRRQREYLWIFCLGLLQAAEFPIWIVCLFHNIPIGWRFLNASPSVFTPFVLVATYFAFVNRRIGPKFLVFLGIAGILNAYSLIANEGLAPNLPGSYGLLTNLPFVVLLAVVVVVVLALDWRRGNREAGILLIPAFLFSLYIYTNYALVLLFRVPAWSAAAERGLILIQSFPAGPFAISSNHVSGILSTIALAIIMVLRSSSTSRRQALLENELAAAQQVQQVLLPENVESVPGFLIESAYQPAQQVGGDFFQIIPMRSGGLMLVVGDVAGKGLPAAMLVSLLVGAIRTAAEDTHDPEVLLQKLNERLVGRSGDGFSTALAAFLAADGAVTIANAGHLSPYLDGREVELPGALPLGIVSGVSYETVRLQLAPGSRLTFYSDGVIEAQNSQGELFGFDRGREISVQPAYDIAEAAREFGQSDDITVVAIARVEAVANAA